MTQSIDRYIDLQIIDEYADRDYKNGWSLDIDVIPENEIRNFLSVLMDNDTTVRDLVLYHMQRMVNDRLPDREVEMRESDGLTARRLSNGDVVIERSRYA